MRPSSKVYVAGHRGLVGSAIVRSLRSKGYENVVTRTHAELDLKDRAATDAFFAEQKPDVVFLAAAKVGGIVANNTYPADFIRDNLEIQCNVIDAAWRHGVKRLLFLGSSCIYPKMAPQPIREESLLTGPLEPTNRAYALAKIAGIEMCWSYNRQHGTKFLAAMPTNMYGPGDNYHLQNSHVIPAMIRKFHLAKLAFAGDLKGIVEDEAAYGAIPGDIKAMLGIDRDANLQTWSGSVRCDAVVLWGTGSPMREFLFSDDLGDACTFLTELADSDYDTLLAPAGERSSDLNVAPLINVGFGSDVTIRELAETVRSVVGYGGQIEYDTSKPDGTPKKLMDSGRLNGMGWKPAVSLEEGLRRAYADYLSRLPS